jgi:membrane fusion protein, heavy metal efflux system
MKRTLVIALSLLGSAALAGLAMAWARPDLVPAWAKIGAPATQTADSGLFCKEHGVPEKFCTLCHEELKDKLLLCKEHGDIPEDICTLCHPEVEEQHKIEMCPHGHGLPKHFCMKCGTGPAASNALPDDGWCALHNKPESQCGECAGEPEAIAAVEGNPSPRVCRQPLPVVRLASAKLVRQVGIESAAATSERHAHKLTANAETAYDANHFAEICPRVVGLLREVRADLGQVVRPGEVLAIVDSPEVSSAKTQYISAQAAVRLAQSTYDRTAALARSNAVPQKNELESLTVLNQAQAAAMDASRKLGNLGLGEEALARVLRDRDTTSPLEVVSPIGGVVVRRHAVQGEAVSATSPLFAVADTSRMWLWIDLYEGDIDGVREGQDVAFTVSGKEASHAGRVTWVGAEVDDVSRTTRVRAELENPEGRLRANQFGRAEIRVGDEHRVVVVPKQAVQRKDNVDLVFLPEGESRFLPRRVVARPSDRPEVVEIAWGLEPGQKVVTRGAFWLKTEIMKGSIGAGCCE